MTMLKTCRKTTSKQTKTLVGASLFSSAGIAETYLASIGVKLKVANELIPARAELYAAMHKGTKMVQGDIMQEAVFDEIIKSAAGKIDFLLASPPCQGISVAGKNRKLSDMRKDERNYLVTRVIDFIRIKRPDYVLIENVPTFLILCLPVNKKLLTVPKLLELNFGEEYVIEAKVLDAADYGVPQHRKRAIIKLYKKGLTWPWPKTEKHVTVEETIGHLPSLNPGEKSGIPWHFAREHSENNILCMSHTPTGKTAFDNKVYFPRKADGAKVKGYASSYRRIHWNRPSPTITMRNDAISSQRNVHPGRPLPDGRYSDPRVLTPLELMLLNSLPEDWAIPEGTPEILVRQCLGESIPPLMIKKIVAQINK